MTTRRQFLAATAGLTVAGAVADSGFESTGQPLLNSSTDGDGAWQMYGNDAANTGFNPEVSGPRSDVGPAWEFETDGQISNAPAVVDGTVYTGSRDGYIYALEADSGEQQWRFDTESDVRSSPAVVDGTLYVGTQAGTVYAVDTEEGDEQWRFGTGGAVRSSPTVVEETVYIGSQDNSVYAIDASEGTERWRFETDFWVESSPAVADGVVYVGSDDGDLYALDATDGEERWTFTTADRVPGSPAVVDETVYVGSQDGNVYALDTTAEGEEHWQFDTGGAITSSPAVADGVVYIGSRSHSVFALDAETGEQQWTFDTGRQITSSPAVADGVVYVGSESHEVYGIDTDGEERWRFDTGRPISAAPAVVDDAVYVGSENQTLYALEEGFETEANGAPGGQEPDDATAADQTDDGDESPGVTLPSSRAVLLPATAVGFAVAVVGGYYVLNRTGMLDPIETASDVYGDQSDGHDGQTVDVEDRQTGEERPAMMTKSQLWELVVSDVIGRASESEVTATQDLVVTKYLDRDTLASPVVAYRIQSVRSEPARVRLSEPLVEFEDETSRPLGDGWRVQDETVVYETVVEAGETVTTLLGRRDCPTERAGELLEKPVVEVDDK